MQAGVEILHAARAHRRDAEHRLGAIRPGQHVGGQVEVPGADLRRVGGKPQGPLGQFDAQVGVAPHGYRGGTGHQLNVIVRHARGQTDVRRPAAPCKRLPAATRYSQGIFRAVTSSSRVNIISVEGSNFAVRAFSPLAGSGGVLQCAGLSIAAKWSGTSMCGLRFSISCASICTCSAPRRAAIRAPAAPAPSSSTASASIRASLWPCNTKAARSPRSRGSARRRAPSAAAGLRRA